nr:hypothetical protein [Tanacetum cinerariifolium]
MIQVKEMMQDKDLKNLKSKDEGSRSRSQSMNDQIHYKQAKTKTKINKAKHKSQNVISSTTKEFEERDLNIGGDCCDPLALLDTFIPVEDNIGLLETRFGEEAIFVFVFPEDVTGSVNLTLLSLFFGVTATNFSLELLMLGQDFRCSTTSLRIKVCELAKGSQSELSYYSTI